MYTYNSSLLKVVDGDTCWLRIDLGFYVKIEIDVRLAGINAPEMKGSTHDAGQASKDALTKLLADANNGIIQVKSAGRDRYGRWIAKLSFVSASTGSIVDVSQAMLAGGWVAVYSSH